MAQSFKSSNEVSSRAAGDKKSPKLRPKIRAAKPAEAKAVDAKPAQAKPAEAKPAEAKALKPAKARPRRVVPSRSVQTEFPGVTENPRPKAPPAELAVPSIFVPTAPVAAPREDRPVPVVVREVPVERPAPLAGRAGQSPPNVRCPWRCRLV